MVDVRIDLLRNIYCERRQQNPHYSLRAFARDLRISSGALSQILMGKRPLSVQTAVSIADALALAPSQRRLLTEVPGACGTVSLRQGAYHEISADDFYLISEWYHLAILSLIKTKGFKRSPRWIARRLGITAIEVSSALARLQKLGLIEEREGQLVRTQQRFATSSEAPSAAIRRYHQQVLQQSLQALGQVAVQERDFSALTVATSASRMAEARVLIKDFRRQLSELLEDGPKEEVYRLNIQFFPLTKEVL